MPTAVTVTLPRYSMFQATPIYGPPYQPEFVPGLIRTVLYPDLTDTIYTVTQGTQNRLDDIATLFYGVPEVWWVLAQVNGILDPWSGVPELTRLRIPIKARLLAAKILNS